MGLSAESPDPERDNKLDETTSDGLEGVEAAPTEVSSRQELLEQQIRAVLFDQRFRAVLEDFQAGGVMLQALKRGMIEFLKAAEEDAEKPFDEATVSLMMANPTFQHSTARQMAEAEFSTLEMVKSSLEGVADVLSKELGVEAEVDFNTPELEQAFREQFAPFDAAIKSLVEQAKEHGLESALSEEAYFEAVRRNVPTREEFLEHCYKTFTLVDIFFSSVQDSLRKSSIDIPEEVFESFEETREMLAKAQSPARAYNGILFGLRADQIYKSTENGESATTT